MGLARVPLLKTPHPSPEQRQHLRRPSHLPHIHFHHLHDAPDFNTCKPQHPIKTETERTFEARANEAKADAARSTARALKEERLA